jgi:hypothetical protein
MIQKWVGLRWWKVRHYRLIRRVIRMEWADQILAARNPETDNNVLMTLAVLWLPKAGAYDGEGFRNLLMDVARNPATAGRTFWALCGVPSRLGPQGH